MEHATLGSEDCHIAITSSPHPCALVYSYTLLTIHTVCDYGPGHIAHGMLSLEVSTRWSTPLLIFSIDTRSPDCHSPWDYGDFCTMFRMSLTQAENLGTPCKRIPAKQVLIETT